MQFNLRKEENKNIDSIFICVCKQLIKSYLFDKGIWDALFQIVYLVDCFDF